MVFMGLLITYRNILHKECRIGQWEQSYIGKKMTQKITQIYSKKFTEIRMVNKNDTTNYINMYLFSSLLSASLKSII